MGSRDNESNHGEGNTTPAPTGTPDQSHSYPSNAVINASNGTPDQPRSRAGNMVFKSGALFISSKGIGWTSWKKRWFILTRTSLVFFRSDPSAIPQKGSEVNLTLGGIDLNNSGSVVVKADKKLLTVLFPDGRDGRAFTLKAETLEDLHEWKAALEDALSQAPNAALVMGQNGIFRNDQADPVDGSWDQLKDRQPVKSLVVGRPILLALEDIDGTPSFLEKALRFIERHGVKVEGILRQAADVDDVERRVREYEQGKIEFSPKEDPHVVADCVKHILRELPSSPVPASCCKALLEACRTDSGVRVNAMRAAISETFPEPNRRLLQRILMMMQTVASHKAENRMSSSAVAACMAPLLLRPLLAGDCDFDNNDFDLGGDGSVQLLQAAAAANHAQAIVITLLEEFDNIFAEGTMSLELFSNTEESGSESESEDPTDDDETYEDEDDDATRDYDGDTDDDHKHSISGSESGKSGNNDLYDDKAFESASSGSPKLDQFDANQKSSFASQSSCGKWDNIVQGNNYYPNQTDNNNSAVLSNDCSGQFKEVSAESSWVHSAPSCIQKSTTIANRPAQSVRRPTVWGRTSARKNLSMESIDYNIEDEVEIQRLEVAKTELQNRIAEEAKGNAVLQASLEQRKHSLHKRRIALEKDVAGLQDKLQKERDLRIALESGMGMPQHPFPAFSVIDEKIKAEIEEIASMEADIVNMEQRAKDLGVQLNQQREQNYGYARNSYNRAQEVPDNQAKLRETQKDVNSKPTSVHRERSTGSKAHQPNPAHDNSSLKSSSVGTTVEPDFIKPTAPTNVKKSGARVEGANATTSALSRLTNRLNFLKERRTQIANELQNLDKGRGSGASSQNAERSRGSEPRQSQENPDKSQGSEVQGQYNQDPARRVGSDVQSCQNPEKIRKSDNQPLHNSNKGRNSES